MLLHGQSLARGNKESWPEVKIILVGEENVGKTTLLNLLRTGKQKVKRARAGSSVATNGISMEKWKISNSITANAWVRPAALCVDISF